MRDGRSHPHERYAYPEARNTDAGRAAGFGQDLSREPIFAHGHLDEMGGDTGNVSPVAGPTADPARPCSLAPAPGSVTWAPAGHVGDGKEHGGSLGGLLGLP